VRKVTIKNIRRCYWRTPFFPVRFIYVDLTGSLFNRLENLT
jgi:hypothetical protein